MADDLAFRLSAVESRLADLSAEMQTLLAENARLRAADPSGSDAASSTELFGRRRLLVGGATAGAAAVVGLLANGQPAAAADGGNLVLGQVNSSSSESKLSFSGSGNNGFRVEGTSSLAVIEGYQSGSAAGVKGANTGSGPGIVGESASGVGITAASNSGIALTAASTNFDGILATTDGINRTGIYAVSAAEGGTGVGVRAEGPGAGVVANGLGGSGVVGLGGERGVHGISSSSGIGVLGFNDEGTGVSGDGAVGGSFKGTAATMRFSLVAGRGAPTADTLAHTVGDVVIDDTGALWYCTASGTPGTWRKLGGTGTCGQLHVLPAPARVYDSRPGSSPAGVGPKTKFAPNTTRTFDLKANSSGVPAGATAALVTILLVNASSTAGNATIWANGVAKPKANSMVWGGTAGRFTATAVTALDTQARVQFNASQTTDLVLDVVGYYR